MKNKIKLIIPSEKISGGTKEAFNLSKNLSYFFETEIISVWRSEQSIDDEAPVMHLLDFKTNKNKAIFQIPFAINKLLKTSSKNDIFILTHYSTLAFSPFLNKKNTFVFVQDIEWEFIKNKFIKLILMKFILKQYNNINIISANDYLNNRLKKLGFQNIINYNIWASSYFRSDQPITQEAKDIDVVFLLREGAHKRSDLYFEAIKILKEKKPSIKIAAISTSQQLYEKSLQKIDANYFCIGKENIRSIFRRSKTFLLLSEHEGFSLPPLEAMGSYCIPYCRNSGGPSAYMQGILAKNLFELDMPVSLICDEIISTINNKDISEKKAKASFEIFNIGLNKSDISKKELTKLINERII